MDSLSKVVDKGTDWLTKSVGREIGYFFIYERSIKSLDKECERLENIRSGVQQGAEASRRNSRNLAPSVQAWLTSVDTTTADVATILQ
ncbi:hypothetical protein FXO38_33692 [Capsicum annuum]|uniref:Uncharacterized protein n=1 Tax=Capsicum annuum TaxID=4072 RepID=A0A2G2YJI5_CAPAN|nr:hypothetical protein FXO38_33692 [Capsicum annuum]KAF3648860.1 hypothetical protein FXO37_19242 [Capsicum annuum]PHT69903.1 hypothetical protein T459_25007 [Capsicum annuum]